MLNPELLKAKKVIAAAAAVMLGGLASGCTSAESAPLPKTVVVAHKTPPTPTLENTVGYDVSEPQCGVNLGKIIKVHAFGIVGENENLANEANPCFKEEYAWARKSVKETRQPVVSTYVLTADPGNHVADWPKTGQNTYGACRGGNTAACAYQYGENLAKADIASTGLKQPGTVYLDVETDFSWEANTAHNTEVLEGMTGFLQDAGATVGIYSDTEQFHDIVGNTKSPVLGDLPEWVAGGGSVVGAKEDCKEKPFTSEGTIVLSQYADGPPPSVQQSPFDLDYACPAAA